MSNTRKKKKKSILQSTFYRVYFALVLLALIGIAIGTGWLRGALKDYEASQPVYVAQDVAKLFEDSDFNALYDVDTSAREVGDKAFYVESMNALAEGRDVEWTETFSADENERKYNVTLNGERFASFTLVPSGQTSPKGNRLWTLGSVTTHVELREPEPEPTPEPVEEKHAYPCKITAPQGYIVTVDGEALTVENAQVAEKNLFEAGFLPESVPNPVMVEYLFDAASVTPSVTAVDENGADVAVTQSVDKALTWSCALREDITFRDRFSDAALALGRRVAKFISKDAGKGAIQKICAKNSPAETIFENLNNAFATPHSSVTFKNENAAEFYALSENCFTCHVTFDYVLKTAKGDKVYPTSYTFCVVHNDTEARLYNILIS